MSQISLHKLLLYVMFTCINLYFSELQTQGKPSTGSASYESHQVDDEVDDKDETEEENEVDDSTYETEEEPATGTESEEDSGLDKSEARR